MGEARRVVYRYGLDLEESDQRITLPTDSLIVLVAQLPDEPARVHLWVEHPRTGFGFDPVPTEPRTFKAFPSGNEIPDGWEHVGSCQAQHKLGALHVYEWKGSPNG